MTLSETTSLIALVFGVSGFVLGVLNHLRDRHKVVVSLQWDMSMTSEDRTDNEKKWGVITVTNVGRRPTYVSHVALKLPKGYDHSHLLINGSIHGKKLTEGDPSEIFIVKQEGLEQYAKDWHRLKAQISDSTGKVWFSKTPRAVKPPSWAVPN
jgi:hypothetical protein